jgi:hypothetical protein
MRFAYPILFTVSGFGLFVVGIWWLSVMDQKRQKARREQVLEPLREAYGEVVREVGEQFVPPMRALAKAAEALADAFAGCADEVRSDLPEMGHPESRGGG